MDIVRLLVSPQGRLNRARYLGVELTLLAVWILPWQAITVPGPLPGLGRWILAIGLIGVNVATTAKRLHDRNRSGWWALAVVAVNRLSFLYYGLYFGLSFGVDISVGREALLVMIAVTLSLLQTWIVIELFFLPGTDGPNRFGADLTRTAPGRVEAPASPPRGIPDFLVRRSGPVAGRPG